MSQEIRTVTLFDGKVPLKISVSFPFKIKGKTTGKQHYLQLH